MDVEPGQLWEMYSTAEKRWVRIVVAKIEDGRVRVRYQGLCEFFTVEQLDIQNKPELAPACEGTLSH
jgi:hypothetical protein